MDRLTIETKINDLLIEEFEIAKDKLVKEASLKKDLAIDSLDIVDIIVLIDKEFGIKVKSEDLGSLKSLGDLYSFIDDRLS